MFSNLRISTRLLLLILVQVAVLVTIAVAGLVIVNASGNSMTVLNQSIIDQRDVGRLSEVVRSELVNTTNEMSLGTITWEEGRERLAEAKSNFEGRWNQYIAALAADEAEFVQDLHGSSLENIRTAINELAVLFESRDRNRLNLFITNDFNEMVEPYFDLLQARSGQQQVASERSFLQAQGANQRFLLGTLIIGAIGILIVAVLGFIIYRSISSPIERISDTVQRISAGDYDVRTEMTGNDEVSELGTALDRLLQERVTTLADAQLENEQLNNSIIQLLQAVFQLSQRDLTVKVPVTEDVTGPVADALNLLTDETSKVLMEVTQISEQVSAASNTVKAQSDKVISLSQIERNEVNRTTEGVSTAVKEMHRVAQLAQTCNQAADVAIRSTQHALETVTNTVDGINNTRDTIRETEKRIKRLGERSQEISSVVSIINSIAERTHILALNASMHAASAGEAGRGFGVVANEVQRLAENAREATSQIATLVSNIQTETAETVDAMNNAISQVVEGSRLAEQAGQQMRSTQQTTSELVNSVQQIAASAQEQNRISKELIEQATRIRQSTEQTGIELQEQNKQTDNLVAYAKGLVESVRVFRLPQRPAETPAAEEAA